MKNNLICMMILILSFSMTGCSLSTLSKSKRIQPRSGVNEPVDSETSLSESVSEAEKTKECENEELSTMEPTVKPDSTNIDTEIAGNVYLLRYDQVADNNKRDVSYLISSGISMKAYFFPDGRGYIVPGAGIEEFTWGNGTILRGSHIMTYTFEGEYLFVKDKKSGDSYWYEKTNEALGEYPTISEDDLP